MFNNPVIKIARREFSRIINSKDISFLYLVLPVAMFIIFSSVYQESIVRELPVAVADLNNTEVSHTLVKYFESSSAMKITAYLHSEDEIVKEFRKGNIDGALYIPARLEETLKSGKQAHVVFYINSTNIIKNNYLLNDGLKIIKTVSAGVLLKKLRSAGLTAEQAMSIINPVKLETQVLYNPNYSYSQYLVPALTTFAFMMIVMLASCLLINREINQNTFSELARLSGNSSFKIIAGKCLAHFVYYIFITLLLTGIILPVFGISLKQAPASSLLILLFAMASFFIGLTVSAFIKREMLCTEAALFIITPGFIFSGVTFPLWAMPPVYGITAQAMPYTHFLSAFIKIYMMGLGPEDLFPEVTILFCFGISALFLSLAAVKMLLNKFREGAAI